MPTFRVGSLQIKHYSSLGLRIGITYQPLMKVLKFRPIEWSEPDGILCKTEEGESFLNATQRVSQISNSNFAWANKTEVQESDRFIPVDISVSLTFSLLSKAQFSRVVDRSS